MIFFMHSALPACPQPLLVRSLQLVEVWPYTEEEEEEEEHGDTFRSPIWESLTKNDTSRSAIWKLYKNWYVQISDLNTPKHVAMTACDCGGTSACRCSYRRRHMPLLTTSIPMAYHGLHAVSQVCRLGLVDSNT